MGHATAFKVISAPQHAQKAAIVSQIAIMVLDERRKCKDSRRNWISTFNVRRILTPKFNPRSSTPLAQLGGSAGEPHDMPLAPSARARLQRHPVS